MKCPVCQHEDSAVIRTEALDDAIRRRRECTRCKHRFNTFETSQNAVTDLVKIKQLLAPVVELVK